MSAVYRRCSECDYYTRGTVRSAERGLADHQRSTGHTGSGRSIGDVEPGATGGQSWGSRGDVKCGACRDLGGEHTYNSACRFPHPMVDPEEAIRADERAKHGERVAVAIEAEREELAKRLNDQRVPSWSHISASFESAARIARTVGAQS